MKRTVHKCIIYFVKYPEKTSVKSRLARVLGRTIAQQFYECFVIDILSVIRESGYPFVICFTPGTAAQNISQWLGRHCDYIPQRGRELGARMNNAFLDVFGREVDQAILIGSDIPGITVPLLQEAFRKLRKTDCVIGPAHDGGYYLIGFKKETYPPDVFKSISWGSDSVFSETIRRLGKKFSLSSMPLMRDIDTFDDLRAFFNTAKGTPLESTRTFALLSQIRNLPPHKKEGSSRKANKHT